MRVVVESCISIPPNMNFSSILKSCLLARENHKCSFLSTMNTMLETDQRYIIFIPYIMIYIEYEILIKIIISQKKD